MRLLLSMAGKDLLRRWRSPLGVLVMLSFPLLFSLIVALVFGTGGDAAIPRAKVLVENHDEGPLGTLLLGAFSSEQMAEFFEAEEVEEEGLARLENDEASALLRIPANATEDLLAGRPVTLELVRNPAQSILPEAAEQAVTVLAEVLDAASRVLRQPLDRISSLLEAEGNPPDEAIAAVSVAVSHILTGAEEYLFPPAITLEIATVGEEEESEERGLGALIFLMVLPGVAVYSLFIIGDMGMRDVLAEQTAGTLRRQLAGPVRPAVFVGAKAVYSAALATICLLFLAAAARVAAGSGVSLPGFALLAAALVLAVAGAASVVYGLARSEQQGSTVAAVVYLLLAFASGSFIQVNNLPAVLQKLSPYSPFRWATEGFQRLLLEEGAGLAEILPGAIRLATLGVALLALGSWLLGRRIRRGAAA